MQLAEALGKPGDMIAAVRLKADLNGLITKQTERGKPGDFDALTDAELAAEESAYDVILTARTSSSKTTA